MERHEYEACWRWMKAQQARAEKLEQAATSAEPITSWGQKLQDDYNAETVLWGMAFQEMRRALDSLIAVTHCPSSMAWRLLAEAFGKAMGIVSDNPATEDPAIWQDGKPFGCLDCEEQFATVEAVSDHIKQTGHRDPYPEEREA